LPKATRKTFPRTMKAVATSTLFKGQLIINPQEFTLVEQFW
jgi:hypothetical protein